MKVCPLPKGPLATVLFAMGVLLLLVGCSQKPPALPPSIRGVVTAADASGEMGTILVVWTDDPQVGAVADQDAASVSVNAETELLRRDAEGEYAEMEFGDIRVGDIVEAWFTGGVRESYPVQADASAVVVTGSYDGAPPTPRGLEGL